VPRVVVTVLRRVTNACASVVVLLVTIDETTIVPFIVNTVQNVPLAVALSTRANLKGAESLFTSQFQRLFQMGQYKEAAIVAASSPGTVLRNQQTIQLFQQLPSVPGQPSPLLQYFGTLLEKGKLNPVESMELVRPVLQQGRKELLEGWLKEDKLECTEELGDLVKRLDLTLALSIYFRAEAKAKVVLCFAESGQYDKIVAYATKVGYTPDYGTILQQVLATNPDAAVKFAQMLLTNPSGPLADANSIIDAFMKKQAVPQITAVLLEALKANRADQVACARVRGGLVCMTMQVSAGSVANAIARDQLAVRAASRRCDSRQRDVHALRSQAHCAAR
jgi:clathrin heavy chain